MINCNSLLLKKKKTMGEHSHFKKQACIHLPTLEKKSIYISGTLEGATITKAALSAVFCNIYLQSRDENALIFTATVWWAASFNPLPLGPVHSRPTSTCEWTLKKGQHSNKLIHLSICFLLLWTSLSAHKLIGFFYNFFLTHFRSSI